MGQRRNIGYRHDTQPAGLQRPYRAFATWAGALHKNIDLTHIIVSSGSLSDALSRELRSERGRLTTALKTSSAAACPAQGVPSQIRYCDNRVVERCKNMACP